MASLPYETAYRLAQEQLAKLDLSDVAFNSSARLEEDTFYLDFLGETYRIENRGGQISKYQKEVKIGEKIILLHYLVTADGSSLTRQEVNFENIPGGRFYYPTFKARTIDYLIKVFAPQPDALGIVAQKIGGRVLDKDKREVSARGTTQIKFLVLPNIPITLLWWQGDAGTGSACQILYDTSITHYLPLEDIVVVTEQLVHKLVQLVKSQVPSGPLYD